MTIKALTREESERTADVAAKVEEVVAAVNRQDAQLDFLLREVKRVEILVTGEGGQAADGMATVSAAWEEMARTRGRELDRARAEVEEHRRHVATVMQREAALKREVERLRRDAVDGEVLDEYEEVTVPELEHERDQLRAERDAAQARVAELEKEDTERLERGREKARHMEKGIATLKHAVREARENLDYGHIWTPNDTQYVRDAIAALSAALDEEATDAE